MRLLNNIQRDINETTAEIKRLETKLALLNEEKWVWIRANVK